MSLIETCFYSRLYGISKQLRILYQISNLFLNLTKAISFAMTLPHLIYSISCRSFVIIILKENVPSFQSPSSVFFVSCHRWLSSTRFKYKPGYRSCDLLKKSSALIGGKLIFPKKILYKICSLV